MVLREESAQADGAQTGTELDDGGNPLFRAQALAQIGQNLEDGLGVLLAQPVRATGARNVILRNEINALTPARHCRGRPLAPIGKDGTQKIVETHI